MWSKPIRSCSFCKTNVQNKQVYTGCWLGGGAVTGRDAEAYKTSASPVQLLPQHLHLPPGFVPFPSNLGTGLCQVLVL